MSNNLYYENKITNGEQIQKVSLSELKPFEEQPFKVLMDESMDELVESIKDSGVMSPIIVRPYRDGGYEILSGHRRAKACELAGKENVPVIVRNLDDDMATIFLVDSNLQRENILPSEKAYAYKLKLEAMKRRAGRPPKENASQVATNFIKGRSDQIMAEQVGESKDQIRRYIRLTELIDPLLDMVDAKKLPVNAAVELSYLGTKAQSDIVKTIEKYEATPSIEQSAKIRKYAKDGKVNEDVIDSIMQEQKPEKIKITFKEDKLRKYFPKSYTQKQMEETMTKLLENWARKRREPER
jgi:ParB family chromosome partitioning protein